MSARIVDQPRFLSREALMAAAKHVAATHPNERIAIVGGTAAQIWGAPRLTSNLDVIAESDLGYKGEPSTIGGVRTVEGGIELNVITRLDEWARLYEDALYAAVRVEGVPLPVVTPEFLVAMKMVAGRLQDKFANSQLTAERSNRVDAPYIKEFPLVLECALKETVELGLHTVFIGEIKDLKADETVLDPGDKPDIDKIRPFMYDHAKQGYNAVGKYLGQAFAIGRELL